MTETIDFVVVGGGMAGLTAGAILARAGRRVAVFERHSKLGGYGQYFGKEPTFDAATHLIGGCGPGGWTRAALSEAGVLDRVELLPLDPVYRAVFPNAAYLAPADPERFRQELSALWPTEAEGLRRFFADVDQMGGEYLLLADGPAREGLLARNQDRTLDEFLNDYTRNPDTRAALGALWLFAGLPPRRLSALHYVMLWHTFHRQGSAAVKGGMKALTDSLAEVIRENDGLVENGAGVERILRNRGWVTGVKLSDGREFRTRAVISTASPHDTFEDLLAAQGQNAAGYPPLRGGFITSVSGIEVHLLVDGPLETPARTTLLHATADLDDAYFDLQRDASTFPALAVTQLDFQDPGRAPEGKHMVVLYTLSPYSRYDDWHVPMDLRRSKAYRTVEEYVSLKESLGDAMVRRAEELIPGLAERTVFRKVGTPLSMERYTHNTGGAAFGWAPVPQQAGAYLPGAASTFAGLLLAGHWTFPGGGIAGAVTSGRIAAQTLLKGGDRGG